MIISQNRLNYFFDIDKPFRVFSTGIHEQIRRKNEDNGHGINHQSNDPPHS